MLNDFIFSLNAVTPIFIIIFVGYLVGAKGLLDKPTVKKMNAVVFNLALPAMLFRDISKSDFGQIFDLSLVLYAVVTTILIFFISLVFAMRFIKEKKSIGSFVQGCFRGNYAILGLPLIANILGSQNTGKGALITTFVLPIYNVLAVIVLSIFVETKSSKKELILDSLVKIIKNPMIIGIVLALPFSYFGIKLPNFAGTSINYIGNLATPLALLGIGAVIDFNDIGKKMKWAVVATVFKLIIAPLIFVTGAIWFGQRGENLVVLYVMYATSTAVSSFIMADAMRNDSELAASIVLMTTLFSLLTFTIGIFIMKSLNFI